VYLLSFYGVWKFINLAHYHPKGRWTHVKPGNVEIFFTVCPIINTCFCLTIFPLGWRKDKHTNFFKNKS